MTCFIDDAAGVRNRDLIGVDTITWECDYPHSDSTWPHAPEKLWKSLGGVPDEDIHKMTGRTSCGTSATIRSRTSRRSAARSRRCARRRSTST